MRDEWSLFRHLKELVKRLLTVSGLAVAGSFLAVIRVLFYGPEFAIWPAIAFYLIAQFNDTGRWLIPPFVEKVIAAKYGTPNGAPKPP